MNDLEEINKFLEMYNLPRLNQEEIENMNRLFTSKEIESVIKNSSGYDPTITLIIVQFIPERCTFTYDNNISTT